MKLRRGPTLMIFATLGFVLMVAFVKVARETMSTVDVMVWRGVFAVPIAWWFARGQRFRLVQTKLFALRCVLGLCAMTCAYAAAKNLAVADLSLIWRMQPLFVAILAPIALGSREKGTRTVFIAMAGGLVGCVILFAPQLEGGSLEWALLALAGAGLSGGAHVCLRRLNATDHSAVIVFWFQAVIVVVCGAAAFVTSGSPFPLPDISLLPHLAGAGFAAAFGQLLMTRAYALDKATTVAVAGYMGPVWAVVVDIIAFALLPGWEVIVGGLIILGASAMLLFDQSAEVPAVDNDAAASSSVSTPPSS